MHPYSTDSLSGLSVDSPLFRQRAPRVQLSDDPDTATAQTVAEMCRQIHQAAKDPLVQGAALNAVRTFRGGPGWKGCGITDCSTDESTDWSLDPLSMQETASGSRARLFAESCWWWCRHYLRFKHHGSMFEAWSSDLGDPRTKLQLLIAPDVLVRMKRMEGDCAIYTMMLCSMIEALGLRWEIVTAAVDRLQPEIFSHVWARVVLPGGSESLDASHGKYPGWQVPKYDLHRIWVFNDGGQRVSEQGPGFSGLHDYRRSRGMAGEVFDPETGTYYDDGTSGSASNPSTTYLDYGQGFPAGSGQFSTVAGAPYSGPAYQAPSQNSAQWASFATSLAKMGMTLAEINAIQPGTVVSANGAILRQNPGYAVGTPTGASNLGLSTSTLMIGGIILLGAVFLFSGRR